MQEKIINTISKEEVELLDLINVFGCVEEGQVHQFLGRGLGMKNPSARQKLLSNLVRTRRLRDIGGGVFTPYSVTEIDADAIKVLWAILLNTHEKIISIRKGSFPSDYVFYTKSNKIYSVMYLGGDVNSKSLEYLNMTGVSFQGGIPMIVLVNTEDEIPKRLEPKMDYILARGRVIFPRKEKPEFTYEFKKRGEN